MRTLMFFGSYCPLFLILGIKYLGNFGLIIFIPCLFCALCVFFVTPSLTSYFNSINSNHQTIKTIQRKDVDILAYMFTYLIPLFDIDFTLSINLIIVSTIFIIIFIFYIRSNVFYTVNPIFNFLGYHLYDIESIDGYNYTLISKNILNTNQQINVIQLEYGIIIEP